MTEKQADAGRLNPARTEAFALRNPNGYGSVVKLSGNRRNPYAVRKTKGWSEKGYPIYETIGYYPTREAGMIALAEYNDDPWNVDKAKITLEELFALWKEKKAPKLGASSQSQLKSAFRHCAALSKMKYKDIRAYQMQDVIDNCGCGYATQAAVKNLFNHLDRFALEMDLINKCYSQLLNSEPVSETSKQPFTDDEVTRLWAAQAEPWVDSVLVFLYSGWRIAELLALKRTDVDLDAGIMRGGVKTKAGKGRVVPIHSKIFEFIRRRYDEGHEYLFADNGERTTKAHYYLICYITFFRLILREKLDPFCSFFYGGMIFTPIFFA
jgi:integrase